MVDLWWPPAQGSRAWQALHVDPAEARQVGPRSWLSSGARVWRGPLSWFVVLLLPLLLRGNQLRRYRLWIQYLWNQSRTFVKRRSRVRVSQVALP